MKHIKKINELFGNLFHKDEKTAKAMLKKLSELKPEIKNEQGGPTFIIDDFDIKVRTSTFRQSSVR